jgi:hypothetical protein
MYHGGQGRDRTADLPLSGAFGGSLDGARRRLVCHDYGWSWPGVVPCLPPLAPILAPRTSLASLTFTSEPADRSAAIETPRYPKHRAMHRCRRAEPYPHDNNAQLRPTHDLARPRLPAEGSMARPARFCVLTELRGVAAAQRASTPAVDRYGHGSLAACRW